MAVLIVGGGVVGLSASLFLAQQGISSTLVERHPGTSIHPRARGVNGRTMELMRSLGLEDEVVKASEKLGPSVGVYSGRTLVQVLEERGDGGWLMRRLRKRGIRGQASKVSPVGPCRCTQDELEPVLLKAARERGVDARFSTELTGLTQDGQGARAELLDRTTGRTSQLEAQWVIAADGARSPLREKLGATVSSSGPLGHQLNLYFRADLSALVKGREFSMCRVDLSERRGLFASINNTDLWVLHVSYAAEAGERPEDFPPERCIELIRRSVGLPSLEVELKGALPWVSAVQTATAYRFGRVFLAGDAAHVMPPWGGFGANTGIQDAHNLAWKLALLLRGQAGEKLLDTYEAERRPVAVAVSAIAGGMSDPRGVMAVPSSWLGGLRLIWQMRKVFPYTRVGYGYSSAAVIGAGAGPGVTDLKGRPGTRVPHVWLERDGRRISTLDLVGPGFTLFSEADGWAEAVAKTKNVPLVHHRVRGFGAAATLVRPDGFVAWAGDEPTELEPVLHRLLSGGEP